MWNYVQENLFLFYIIRVIIIYLPEVTAFPYIIKINVVNNKTFLFHYLDFFFINAQLIFFVIYF